jgi:glycosyltransferase involved in cell wall biosynthesis
MAAAGWEVTLLDEQSVTDRLRELDLPTDGPYRERLRRFLHRVSGDYDVIEYDHSHLPFPREEFSPSTLMVARSVLLGLHDDVPFPLFNRFRDRMKRLICRGPGRAWNADFRVRTAKTIWQADLVNVSNLRDAELLRALGYPEAQIVVQPYAIPQGSAAAFQGIDLDARRSPSVVFLGSFDARKGAPDLPAIFAVIAARIPSITFHLLGTAGQFQSAREVRACFPWHLRSRLRVIPRFTREELPGLLAPLSVGVFPSYLEGFGIAVLEQLASGLPVVAYDSPGPADILPSEWLVERGDPRSLAERVVQLLADCPSLQKARQAARVYSRRFDWATIGVDTGLQYRARLQASLINL